MNNSSESFASTVSDPGRPPATSSAAYWKVERIHSAAPPCSALSLSSSSLWSEAREGLKVHPTVKPVAMLEDAILDVTERAEVLFDPFAGSGSTLIAAGRTGRMFCGSELDPLYVDVILRRWIGVSGSRPILQQTGE